MDGMRHDQLLLILAVPNAVHDALKDDIFEIHATNMRGDRLHNVSAVVQRIV